MAGGVLLPGGIGGPIGGAGGTSSTLGAGADGGTATNSGVAGAGGGGGSGSVGGNGGTGGRSTIYGGTPGVGGAGATSAGQSGGNGTQAAGDAGGGGGGGGVHGFINAILPTIVAVTGGSGGAGGRGSGLGFGGGGGAGGAGAVVTGIGNLGTLNVAVTGGNGGFGADSLGSPSFVGYGGGGGGGLIFTNSSASFTNNATIAGGNGGSSAYLLNTASLGAGGAGISGAGLTITNIGTISGGRANAGSGAQADAIDFTGGSNSLTLSNGGTTGAINGGIGVAGSLSIDPGTAAGANATLANQIHDYNGTAGSLTKVGAGTLTLTGANTYSGGTTVSGGTLQLGSSSAAGTGAVTFGSMSGTATARLGLDLTAQPASGGTFGNTIANFGSGNEIALAGLTNSNVSYNSANSSITVTGTRSGGGQVSENFVLSAPRTTSFTATDDGQGNTIIRAAQPAPAPCYVSGTCIRVLRGCTIQDVPVERLRVGDLAFTASGKPRPIRWVGSRAYPGFAAPKADRPVRIRAGALHDGVPARDLLVSPDHCLWLDGLLVAAGHLVNGTSITRGEAVADLTYWHIELDSHDMLLAEGAAAESFLAAPGVRAGFDGVGDTAEATIPAVPYAERTEHGPELTVLRERLILRAGLSIEPMRFGTVRAWMDRCDGRRVAGWAQDDAHPDAPVCLDVVVDGALVAMTLAEEYRVDIAAAGIGNGCHGFDVDLDEPLSPGIPHVVEVRRSADALRVCAMEVDATGAWTALLAA